MENQYTYTPNKKFLNLKNQKFIDNSKDPNNEFFVLKIRRRKVMKDTQFKQNRVKWDLVWQYYRDRGSKSIADFLMQNKGHTIEITYSGIPEPFVIDLEIIKGKIPKTVDHSVLKKKDSHRATQRVINMIADIMINLMNTYN